MWARGGRERIRAVSDSAPSFSLRSNGRPPSAQQGPRGAGCYWAPNVCAGSGVSPSAPPAAPGPALRLKVTPPGRGTLSLWEALPTPHPSLARESDTWLY